MLIKNRLDFSRSRDQRQPGSLLPKRKDPGYEDGDVLEKLSKLNPRKAHGPDGIPTWVLKENADILELPVN